MDQNDLSLALQCAQALPHWLLILLAPAVSGIAGHLDAVIKQPAAGSLWLLIRKPLSILGGNYGWARNADQEPLADWWAAHRQTLIAYLVQAAGNAMAKEIAAANAAAALKTDPAASAAQPPAQEGQ